MNSEINGWISIPGTKVDYPVLHHLDDEPGNEYYLYRNVQKADSKPGSIFLDYRCSFDDVGEDGTLQTPNSDNLIIYGHNMANRSMFGGLQSYGETLKFDDNAIMYIYQPGRQVTYRFFACIPYDTSHILYYHDFTDDKVFNAFFEALGKAADDPKYKSDTEQNAFYSAEGCVNVDKKNLPTAGDKVMVLSVCKNGDDYHRYLLMAKMVEDTAAPVVMTKEEAEAAGVTPDRILDKDAVTGTTVTNKTDGTDSKTDSAKTDTSKPDSGKKDNKQS